MTYLRNDFAEDRGSILDDPDAAYEERRDRLDEEARVGQYCWTAEEQAKLDAFDRSEVELTNQLIDRRWGA